MKRKIAKIVAAAFMLFMVLLTFFSKTIYRSTLPNVKLIYPKGGTLTYQFVVHTYTLWGNESIPYYIPVQLPTSFSIDEVFVAENDMVDEGAALLHFYEPQAEIILKEAMQKKAEAYAYWRTWSNSFGNAVITAEQKLAKAVTNEEREQATSELALLREGIFNGISEDLVYGKYTESCQVVDELLTLQKSAWVITAPYSGIVGKVYVSKGDCYTGINPLMELYTAGTKPDIVVELNDYPQYYTDAWTCAVSLTDRFGRVDCTLKQLEKMEKNTARITIAPNGLCDYSSITQISVTVKTPYQPLLVPNHSLQGKECYVLEESVGAWGQVMYTAKRKMLSLGTSNDNYTVIQEGINKDDILIISTSSPITDGCSVVVE